MTTNGLPESVHRGRAARRGRWIGLMVVGLLAACDPSLSGFDLHWPDARSDLVDGRAGSPDARPVPPTDAAIDPTDAAVPGDPSLDCEVPLICPASSTSLQWVCGRLWDIETDRPISATTPGDVCGTGGSGACSLTVRFYDTFELFTGPRGRLPTEVVPHSLWIDDCGRVRANVPSNPVVFAVVDDAEGAEDRHVPTSILLWSPRDVRLYATRADTDRAWTSSAGLSGPSFATRGVAALLHSYQGVPRSGVTALRSNIPVPDEDFYFSDADTARSALDPDQATTGTNGTALVIPSDRGGTYGASGSEPSGCRWGPGYAISIPGFVTVVPRVPLAGATDHPCP